MLASTTTASEPAWHGCRPPAPCWLSAPFYPLWLATSIVGLPLSVAYRAGVAATARGASFFPSGSFDDNQRGREIIRHCIDVAPTVVLAYRYRVMHDVSTR